MNNTQEQHDAFDITAIIAKAHRDAATRAALNASLGQPAPSESLSQANPPQSSDHPTVTLGVQELVSKSSSRAACVVDAPEPIFDVASVAHDPENRDLPPVACADLASITEAEPVDQPAEQEMMNGKPVLYRDAKTVMTFDSDPFHHKLLCDGITYNSGDACGFSCTYCYVEGQALKFAGSVLFDHNLRFGTKLSFQDVVIRRRRSLDILRFQLVYPDGTNIYNDPTDTRVVYSSTLVDVAANTELLQETADSCNLILEHTHFQIRLLSKSSLLARLVTKEMIPKKYHHRLILGFSIGTLDDNLGAVIEKGTGKVSKRIKALHELQDLGIRTFGMICPSLPQDDYEAFSREVCEKIRVNRCEHVWAEVINVRGESLKKTSKALREGGFEAEAKRLETVMGSGEAWEEYSRQTFLAHTKNVPPKKLRFLQYVDEKTALWWAERREFGAMLLGKTAENLGLLSTGLSAAAPELRDLEEEDLCFLSEREKLISDSIQSTNVAACALYEIYTYCDGILWRGNFANFEAYINTRWDYSKGHGYRLLDHGRFLAAIAASGSPDGNCPAPLEGQVRSLRLNVPKELQMECWNGIVNQGEKVTGGLVKKVMYSFLEEKGLKSKDEGKKKPKPPLPREFKRVKPQAAKSALLVLRDYVACLQQFDRMEPALTLLQSLIDNPNLGKPEVSTTAAA